MKKIKLIILIIALTMGVVLLFNKSIGHFLIASNGIKISKSQFEHNNKSKNHNANFDWNKTAPLSSTDIVKARLTSPSYIGLISIPDLNVMLPISPGTSNESLSLGAGTLFPNQKMGADNYSLASHFVQGSNNKALLFSPIYYHGKAGQKIYLTDLENVYEYKATLVKVIKASDVSVTDNVPGKKLITLITCDYTADRGRVLMQGKLISVTKWQKSSHDVKEQFTKKAQIL
ncbi:MAG TPA: class A sortase [Lactobacillaceae bacterium]|jgi:sortase A